jgi:hypothetical protein
MFLTILSIIFPNNLIKLLFGLWDIFLVFYSLFLLAWLIVGAIALFRDSIECKGQPFWNMSLACWIYILLKCPSNWVSYNGSNKKDK